MKCNAWSFSISLTDDVLTSWQISDVQAAEVLKGRLHLCTSDSFCCRSISKANNQLSAKVNNIFHQVRSADEGQSQCHPGDFLPDVARLSNHSSTRTLDRQRITHSNQRCSTDFRHQRHHQLPTRQVHRCRWWKSSLRSPTLLFPPASTKMVLDARLPSPTSALGWSAGDDARWCVDHRNHPFDKRCFRALWWWQ